MDHLRRKLTALLIGAMLTYPAFAPATPAWAQAQDSPTMKVYEQAGFTGPTIEFEGQGFQRWDGSSMWITLYGPDGGIVRDDKHGVTGGSQGGKISTSVKKALLTDGDYSYVVTTIDHTSVVLGGVFNVTGGKSSPKLQPAPPANVTMGDLVGQWDCIGHSVGGASSFLGNVCPMSMNVSPDGTYSTPNGGGGSLSPSGNVVGVSGSLAAWGSSAQMTQPNLLQFSWTDPQGWPHVAYFEKTS